jgi:hypothetical protein
MDEVIYETRLHIYGNVPLQCNIKIYRRCYIIGISSYSIHIHIIRVGFEQELNHFINNIPYIDPSIYDFLRFIRIKQPHSYCINLSLTEIKRQIIDKLNEDTIYQELSNFNIFNELQQLKIENEKNKTKLSLMNSSIQHLQENMKTILVKMDELQEENKILNQEKECFPLHMMK